MFSNQVPPSKVAVFCILRDAEDHLKDFFSNLESLISLSDMFDFSFYFYENDSKDKTKELLEGWLRGKKGDLLSEDFGAEKFESVSNKDRVELLALCRNKNKSQCQETHDYALIVDSDVKFNRSNLLRQVSLCHEIERCGMVTANIRQNIPDFTFDISEDSYYDSFAVRDSSGQMGLYWADCPFRDSSDKLNWSLGSPVSCQSAFGGFAILPFQVLMQKGSWSAENGQCEHVGFCKNLTDSGFAIISDPISKVFVEIDLSKHNLEDFKKIAKQQQL